jgi:hypothetical protein
MPGDARSFRIASAHSRHRSWSVLQCGASSVGPSEQVGGKRYRLVCRQRTCAAPKRSPVVAYCGPLRPQDSVMKCLNLPLEQIKDLGPDAARASFRHSGSTARCAGCGGIGMDAGTSIWLKPALEDPALHREAERDTTGSLYRQHQIHTWNDRFMQGKRRLAATLGLIRTWGLKLPLTVRSYCDKRAARRLGIRWRAAQITGFYWV